MSKGRKPQTQQQKPHYLFKHREKNVSPLANPVAGLELRMSPIGHRLNAVPTKGQMSPHIGGKSPNHLGSKGVTQITDKRTILATR